MHEFYVKLIYIFLDAFDTDLMLKVLKEILEGNEVLIPVYDFKSNCR